MNSIKSDLHTLRYNILSAKEDSHKRLHNLQARLNGLQQELNGLYEQSEKNYNVFMQNLDRLIARVEAAAVTPVAKETRCDCDTAKCSYEPQPCAEPETKPAPSPEETRVDAMKKIDLIKKNKKNIDPTYGHQ